MKTTLNKTLATSYIRSHNAGARWINSTVPLLIKYLYDHPMTNNSTESDLYDILAKHEPYSRGLHAYITGIGGYRHLVITNKKQPKQVIQLAQAKEDGYQPFTPIPLIQLRDFEVLQARTARHEKKAQQLRAKLKLVNLDIKELRQLHATLKERGILIEEKEQISVDTLQTPNYTSPTKAINENQERPIKRKRD